MRNAVNETVVEIEDLSVAYDDKPVLWDIDLQIPAQKLVAVVGPNGAGKSTLIKAMLGLIQPITGTVRFFPEEAEEKRRLQNRIGYVPQSGSVDWDFPATVSDVVMMGNYGKLGWIRRPGGKEKQLSQEMIKMVGMSDYANRQISQLSGGQQQRVFLARALVQQADIYLMDEPLKGVDAQTEKTIINLLKALKEQKKTVVVVHHDLQTVTEYFDWVTLINRRIIASGPVDDVFNEENLKKAYRNTGKLLKDG